MGIFLKQRKTTHPPPTGSAFSNKGRARKEETQSKGNGQRPYKRHPPLETLAVYGGSDYAVTSDGGDYTCHVVVGLDSDDRLYLLDLWRGQSATDVWIREWCRLVREWKPLDWAEEQGQITAGVGPFLEQQARINKAYVNREQFPTRGDKATRAQSIRGRMAVDGLYVPTSAPWYADFRSELLSFPAGRHDDQVDALGLVGQLLAMMVEGRTPAKEEKKKPKVGYSAHELEQESFKVY